MRHFTLLFPHESDETLNQHCCLKIVSDSLWQVLRWTMKRCKEHLEIKTPYSLRVNDFLFIKQLLLKDCGIAYVPSILVSKEIQQGKLVRLFDD